VIRLSLRGQRFLLSNLHFTRRSTLLGSRAFRLSGLPTPGCIDPLIRYARGPTSGELKKPDMANHAHVRLSLEACKALNEAASHVRHPLRHGSWNAGLDSGCIWCCPSHFPCDWGITPVDSDDHIKVCISEARWVDGLTEWEGQILSIGCCG
jgi:hypothetical protein